MKKILLIVFFATLNVNTFACDWSNEHKAKEKVLSELKSHGAKDVSIGVELSESDYFGTMTCHFKVLYSWINKKNIKMIGVSVFTTDLEQQIVPQTWVEAIPNVQNQDFEGFWDFFRPAVFICEAEVLTSACGSGIMEIVI